MRTCRSTLLAVASLSLVSVHSSQMVALAAADFFPASPGQLDLEAARRSGDLSAERRHAWALFAQLTRSSDALGRPMFESWHGEDATFAGIAGANRGRGIRGFSRVSSETDKAASGTASPSQSADTPVISYTLYNDAAYAHIRYYRLFLQSKLRRLRQSGAADDSIPGDRTVPPFPERAMVLKTAWWPVARSGFTALPVWDSNSNPPRRGGNGYTTWRRVVAIDPHGGRLGAAMVPVEFAGQSYASALRTDIQDIYHVAVSADLAQRLSRDRSAQKLAAIVLGRPLEAGDFLLLVATNLATKELRDWTWATYWWHDRADAGELAANRPPELDGKWANYLMQVAFDEILPVGADQTAHICFDPWLEGRFPDGGQGGGTVSNCLACHRRASYPNVAFLPITRGAPRVTNDPAYAPGLVRTNFLWSLALHARP